MPLSKHESAIEKFDSGVIGQKGVRLVPGHSIAIFPAANSLHYRSFRTILQETRSIIPTLSGFAFPPPWKAGTMSKYRILILTSILGVALGSLSSAQAQEAGQGDDGGVLHSAEQAILTDAASFARLHGTPTPEAERRLRLRQEADQRLSELRSAFAGRYAGGYIVHTPHYGVVMRLTGGETVAAQTLTLPSGEFHVRFETGAGATLQALTETISAKLPALRAAVPTLQGVGVDERSGEIVLKAHATGPAAAGLLARDAELTTLVGEPVRIETVAEPAQLTNIRGGTRLFEGTSWCTGAFVGQTSSARVLLTAGHCSNNLTFEGNDGTTNYAMTYVTGIFDADQDVQYHRSTTGMLPEFWADTNVRRTLTGRRLRTSTFAGDEFCHHGKATGYSCGLVTTTTHAPTFAGACGGQTCAPVWINLEGPSLRLNRGDSGGPVFVSTVAAGIQSSGSFNSTTGEAYYVTYMTTDTLPSGVSLLYGS